MSFSREQGVSSDEHRLHLKEYLRILSRRKWLILTSLLVMLYIACGYLLVKKQVYRTNSMLLVEFANPNVANFQLAYDPPLDNNEFNQRTFMETQNRLILCLPRVEETFCYFRIGEMASFQGLADPVREFTRCFTVTPVRRTQLVQVSFEWHDPDQAAEILAYHVEAFLADFKKRHLDASEEGLDKLRKKAADLKPRLEKVTKELQHFKVVNNLVSLDKSQDIIVERMKALNQQLVEAEMARIQAETKYQDIIPVLERDLPYEEMPEIMESGTVRDLKLEYIRTQQVCKDLESRFGTQHPEMQAATAKLESVAEKLKSEVMHVLATAKAAYKRALVRELQLQVALHKQHDQVLKFNEKSAEYESLSQDFETLNKTYTAIALRIEEIEISMAAGDKGKKISLISASQVPKTPLPTRNFLILALAALVGLGLGIVLCFFVDYLDTTIKSLEDLQSQSSLPVIGCLPFMARVKGRRRSRDKALWKKIERTSRQPEVREALRSIRMRLSMQKGRAWPRTLVITSASPGEGKTLASLHLALAMARAGKMVLVVDADLHQQRLTRIMKGRGHEGLTDLLRDGKGLPGMLRSTPQENLFFLPGGSQVEDPADLFEGDRWPGLIREMANRFDHVLFDAPALKTSLDGLVLSRFMDVALLVVRAFSSERKSLKRAQQALLSTGAGPVGLLLNAADLSAGVGGGSGRLNLQQGVSEHEKSMDHQKRPAEKETVCIR